LSAKFSAKFADGGVPCGQRGGYNNSIQFNSLLFYVPSQQPQGQLQTQHSTDIHNCIMNTQHKVKGKLQEHILQKNKQTNKQAKMTWKGNFEQKIFRL
jgi:hypothetical protein